MVGYGVLSDVFIEVDPGKLRSLANHLAGIPQITYVACATGETDIIISVRARDIKELFNFVIDVIGKIPGVRHTQTYPLPLNIKNNFTWMPPNVLDEGEDNASNESHHNHGE
jgi:DNA-binding Lrp family transcriptional regulator